MFVNIKQVKSNLKNEFEIHIKGEDGKMMYIASSPWLQMNLPFNLENLRKLYFRDINGSIIYSSKYEYLENTLGEYTYSKNNKYYNPKWISDNFGEEELLKINEKIEEQERKIKKQISKVLKIIGVIWGGIFVFGIILFIIIQKMI